MSDSDEESVVSTYRSYGPGDIFGKYDPDKLMEDGPTDNSTDEDEEDEDEEEEDEDEEDEEEEDIHRKKKRHKIRAWDVLVNIKAENLQDTFNETEEAVAEHQNMDIREAEEMAYEELKPHYLSELISRFKYLVGMTAAFKKDPVHQRITRTAKRLREEEDYDDDESMQKTKTLDRENTRRL